MSDCRLCSLTDRAALIEHVAEQMWESRRADKLNLPRLGAAEFWRERFVELAVVAVSARRQNVPLWHSSAVPVD